MSESTLLGELRSIRDEMGQLAVTQASMDTTLKTLVGNGRPGRIEHLEALVQKHDRRISWASGVMATFMGLITLLEVWWRLIH